MEIKIKPNDLRIGNIVEYNGKECKVLEIHQNAVIAEHEGNRIVFGYHAIEPIQITEEHLRKYGFKDDKYDRGTWIHEKFCIYRSFPDLAHWRQVWSINADGEDVGWNIVNDDDEEMLYLHELQNYFYIVNKEELI